MVTKSVKSSAETKNPPAPATAAPPKRFTPLGDGDFSEDDSMIGHFNSFAHRLNSKPSKVGDVVFNVPPVV